MAEADFFTATVAVFVAGAVAAGTVAAGTVAAGTVAAGADLAVVVGFDVFLRETMISFYSLLCNMNIVI